MKEILESKFNSHSKKYPTTSLESQVTDHRPYSAGRGFTLIELVLVIGLLGVLAVGAVVFSFDFKRSYIEVAQQKVISDVEFARGQAMTKKGTTFGVYFDDADDQYTVYEGTISTPVANPLTKQDMIETFEKWPTVTMTGGDFTVEFNSVGAPTTGGGGHVILTDGSVTKTVTVTAGTGRVSGM